ncbi:MAG: hypothetical protein A2583_01120 [Bdellovibrionales bacterium RIFOXYD1_FULL_53_11]|nr:MAG: hypothetical protein A2583_01120 [Bdellovibrionales bacterium RIFOXYD1_FULL_53_11]
MRVLEEYNSRWFNSFMRSFKGFTGVILMMLFVSGALVPGQAHALHKDVKAVIILAAYGAVGGTAMGAVAYPFTSRFRTVLMGTSIGLYLGIAAGVYHISHRDDPGNPFNQHGPVASMNPYNFSGEVIYAQTAFRVLEF